ncbi:MAG: efflux RND transporter periplasmic adaptor subunit [Deltaproteobacteria bacterium]
MKRIKTLSILAALLLGLLALYKFGYKIPILSEIPFFAAGHRHQLKPVLNDAGDIDYWTCTMHPSVRLKQQGECPLCGMDLVPVRRKPSGDLQGAAQAPGMQEPDALEGIFTVSPERQQVIGVKTERASMRKMTKIIRAAASVEVDESKITLVQTRFGGWIDHVYADYPYRHVKRGEPLFSIYSPEAALAQEEYLLAARSQKILEGSEFPEISRGAVSLVEAARLRLRRLNLSEGQIRELDKSGHAEKNLVVYSPASGFIVEKNAYPNMYVEPNMKLYSIADHSAVWVNADIYQTDISLVQPGHSAIITIDAYPGEKFMGRVKFILPHVMAETRTAKVRMEFANPHLKLLPGMYATAELLIPIGESLAVPESAVLRGGRQDIVFVDKGRGSIEMRRIEVGRESEGYAQVLRGLSEGERVITRANFLIDAESKIQAAVASWGGGGAQTDTDASPIPNAGGEAR